jgi:hypothetical protein
VASARRSGSGIVACVSGVTAVIVVVVVVVVVAVVVVDDDVSGWWQDVVVGVGVRGDGGGCRGGLGTRLLCDTVLDVAD